MAFFSRFAMMDAMADALGYHQRAYQHDMRFAHPDLLVGAPTTHAAPGAPQPAGGLIPPHVGGASGAERQPGHERKRSRDDSVGVCDGRRVSLKAADPECGFGARYRAPAQRHVQFQDVALSDTRS
ncbi:hypothetical protein KFE25_003217 [Diacronema lutheri]|uniref:Uncharacterized protein n=2 Tax=Diacronema lutheri TaxID=2081491 RepID=A0A8J6C929_DIALT|nr:hypothetical protein KFE25_003217 [Diacronema lutheri]